jgi:FlaA1/EpsC-like NDP-sugar epimerase
MTPSPAPSSVSWTQRALFFLVVYGSLAAGSLWFAYELRFTGANVVGAEPAKVEAFLHAQRPAALLWVVPLKFLLLGLAGQFRGVFYYFRLHDALRMAGALATATLLMLLLPEVAGSVTATAPFSLPRGVTLVDFNLSLLLFVGFRVSIRALRERFSGQEAPAGVVERLVVVGAGRLGEQLVAELRSRRGHGLEPVCFVDDDLAKHGLSIHGLPVAGAPEGIPQLVDKFGVTEVILALPSNSAKRIREISAIASRRGLRVRVVPSMSDLAGGRVRATDLRPVSVEDLLGRQPAQLDDAAIGSLIAGRTVLVTGAGGSIGQEICRQVAARNPGRLLLLDQCEVLLYQTEQALIAAGAGALITPLVGDVTDEARLREVFTRFRPELVLHAAAHKHVPLMESQPGEALKNNVLGTASLARLASEHGVGQFVLISSDKAVNPTNVMGASKRLSELVIQGLQAGSATCSPPPAPSSRSSASRSRKADR